MTLKVAMLETLVRNMLASGFEHESEPLTAVRVFADQYRACWESMNDKGDPQSKLLGEEVWNQFLDSLVSEVQRRSLPPRV